MYRISRLRAAPCARNDRGLVQYEKNKIGTPSRRPDFVFFLFNPYIIAHIFHKRKTDLAERDEKDS